MHQSDSIKKCLDKKNQKTVIVSTYCALLPLLDLLSGGRQTFLAYFRLFARTCFVLLSPVENTQAIQYFFWGNWQEQKKTKKSTWVFGQ